MQRGAGPPSLGRSLTSLRSRRGFRLRKCFGADSHDDGDHAGRDEGLASFSNVCSARCIPNPFHPWSGPTNHASATDDHGRGVELMRCAAQRRSEAANEVVLASELERSTA